VADDVFDPTSRLDKLIAQQEPRFAASFAKLVAGMKSSMDLTEIADLLQAGRLEQALGEALRRAPALGNMYTDSFVAAAKDTADFLQTNLLTVVADFDQTNPFAVAQARENQLRLVNGFTRTQTAATREALLEGIRAGANPIQQARNFRNSIGLTQTQVKAVNNFERMLTENDPGSLSRQLRDRRFDRAVQRAIRTNSTLSDAQIRTMTDRYREKYLQYRSEVIARTESLRSVHAGKNEMYRQAVEAGDINADQLTQEWETALDPRVRDSHNSMHGQKQPFEVPFISGLGNQLRYPTDPAAPPADSIQCRCRVGTRITAPLGATLGSSVAF
jgi:hypothetical protein